MTGRRKDSFGFPRELLLTEVGRRCRACDARARLGLTKEEARAYCGFECERCGSWNEDELTERDVPEWWEELRVTGLDTLRVRPAALDAQEPEPDAVVRLSEAWRLGIRDAPAEGAGEDSL